MSAEGQQEPSMEDILASIRKILSEDDAEAATPAPAEAAAQPAPVAPPPPPPEPEPVAEPEPEPEIVMAEEPEPEPVAEPEEDSASIFDEPEEEELELQADQLAEAAEEEPLQLSDEMIVEQQEFQPEQEPVYDQHSQYQQPQDFGQGYQQLVSEQVAQASSASIATLASAVARERAVALGNSGITLEQLVREICTPILKEWLDTNLPYMVERVVKQEIERIVTRTEGLQ